MTMKIAPQRRDRARETSYTVSEPTALLPFLLSQIKGKSRNNVKSLLSHKLVTVDGRGRELGRVEMGMAQTVAVNGKYVAYLTGDGLTISGKRLEAWYTGQGAAAMVCICENGAAYLANARTAWRFSP